jgi:type VI secretion system secreted protein Hcp
MAYEAYGKVKFNKQGASKGESTKDKRKDWFPILSFNFEVLSPRDVATGQPSGKRQYKPIRVTKEWGGASPQLMMAVARNEQCDSVWFEFITHLKDGTESVYYTITLTNASVSGVSMYTGDEGVEGGSSSKHTSEADTMELERVAFTFQKIEVNHTIAKTTFLDDWQAVNA